MALWYDGWSNPVGGNKLVGRLGFLILVGWALWAGPTVGAAEPWRFIMTCDSRGGASTGINEDALAELVREIQRWDVDFIVFPGDLVYGARIGAQRFESQLRTWVHAMEPIYETGMGVYVCRGNHEVGDMWDAAPGQPPNPWDNYAIRWLNVFGNDEEPGPRLPDNGPPDEKHMSYSVVHKNALVVAVDEYAGVRHWLAHSVNQPWLDSLFAANGKPHVFVFGHEPAFQALHPDCLGAYPDRRDAFWRSLKMAGARVYLCGHDHFYDHAQVDDGDGNADNDIHQLIVGSAGAYPYVWSPPYEGNNTTFTVTQVSHADSYGYLVVEVNDLDVTVTWMQRQDNDLQEPGVYEARDTWSYKVDPGPTVLQPNGGEHVSGGRPYPIRWRTTDGVDVNRVIIEYSLDDGKSWTTAGEVDNIRAYEWTVPSVNSDACLIRVKDAHDGTIGDASDKPFSIITCPVKLAADLNDDCRVDFADLAILAGEWLAQSYPSDSSLNPQK